MAMALTAGCAPVVGTKAPAPTPDFVVAPDGNDAGPGSVEQPFATLARARDAVRPLIAAGLTRDVTVLLRGGTRYLPQGIALGPEDSGTAEHRITYAAWPGEVPMLVGGVAVTGWTKHAENVWQAAIPEGIQPTQLFENGERLALARAPNEGYFHIENAVPGQPKTAFVYRPRDLDPKGWDWAEGRVFMWPTHDWFSTDKPIAGIDAEKRIITLKGTGGYDIRANNRYFVQNVLALLDAPGECVIRLKDRKLFVWLRQTPIEQQTLVAASAPSLIAIKGDGEKVVRNLHFEGLDLSIANGDVVSISGAEDCSLRFCKVENGGACGVSIHGHAQRIALYGNLIRSHGLYGVNLQGNGPGQPDVNHHNVVENNHIHHCGRLVGHGCGVHISQSGHNRVVHNHIHHMPRYATTIKGVRYQVLKEQVKGVTFENRHDFLHSRNNLIAYNHIHHVNQDSQDTGAMESWGPGRDNVYDHNLIHDVGTTQFTLQSGLYLDDATDYFTVTNNVIYGVTGAGRDQPIYAKGIGNRIANNILVVGPTNVTAIHSLFMANERCDSHEYARNVIVCEGAAAPPKGAWGGGVGNIHDKGTTLAWKIAVPADGLYHLWLRYAALNKPYGRADLDGRFTMAAGGESVTLQNLPDTGGWGEQKWSPAACAAITLKKGEQALTWTNVKGGGLNWDAFVLCTDPAWKPQGTELEPPAAGQHLVVVQAETHIRPGADADRRTVYQFDKWSDDRVAAADYNLFWKAGGDILVKKAGKIISLDDWRQLLDGKFDQRSLVADPLFRDLAGRDFRLRPDSPAVKLGFQPIDLSTAGLKPDFPARFGRE